MQDIFNKSVAQSYIDRINRLRSYSPAQWGTMNASQMLAHCCVTYEMVYEPQLHRPVGGLAKWILKNFVKKKVVGEKPYPHSTPTAPQFRITGTPDFDEQRKRLVGYIQKTQQLGRSAFDGKESFSFGKLTGQEWNNMFAKHLDHHLRQFGV